MGLMSIAMCSQFPDQFNSYEPEKTDCVDLALYRHVIECGHPARQGGQRGRWRHHHHIGLTKNPTQDQAARHRCARKGSALWQQV